MDAAPLILVTGATGFVGTALLERLVKEKVRIRAGVLQGEEAVMLPAQVERVTVPPLSQSADHGSALQGVDIVIHLAARVHVMNDTAADPLQAFREVNLHGTERLARQAASMRVRRFVFISTVKVHGEENPLPYRDDSPLNPTDPYGVSKLEAEVALKDIAAETGMEVVVVRPPLVYGPGVKANFRSLLRVVERGVPLPLASVENRRSLVYLGNLVDALACCALHRDAAGNCFLVSDGEDVSTPELVRRMAHALGRPSRLIPFPASLLFMAGKITGRERALERLLGSLSVDSSGITARLGWLPPFTLQQGLENTVQWYKKQEE